MAEAAESALDGYMLKPHKATQLGERLVAARVRKVSLQGIFTAIEEENFEEAARLRDEVKRLEAVELAVADDPLARQSVIDDAVEEAVKSRGRSTAGRAGQRGGKRSNRGR